MKIKDKEKFCKEMGYFNIAPCIEKLDFLEKHGIEKYLKHNFKYDFVTASEILLKKVIEKFGDEKDMELFNKTREKLSKTSGHLFVETNFKRQSEPIFVLAMMEGVRNISIDRREFDDNEEELNFVKNFVKKHYQENNGELPLWGKIQHYVYKSPSFEKILILDKNGNIIEKSDIYPISRATIHV